VNFPDVVMAREAPFRVGIANSNVPNMVGQISTAMAKAGLNIHNMINKSKGEMAYTLVDVDTKVPAKLIEQIGGIEGVLAVRYLPVDKA
jgi:D-3-phosphoglycerate dehydrogenase